MGGLLEEFSGLLVVAHHELVASEEVQIGSGLILDAVENADAGGIVCLFIQNPGFFMRVTAGLGQEGEQEKREKYTWGLQADEGSIQC